MMVAPFPGGLTAPSDWIDGILPLLPNANVDWIKNEVLIKARTFFSISGAWRDWIGPINMSASTHLYSPELSDIKAALVAVLDGYRTSDGFKLALVRDWLPSVYQTILDEDHPGSPQYVYQTVEGLLAIFPKVAIDGADQVYLYVSMKPIDLCMPEWIRDRCFDAIRAGVLSAGYAMPGVNYKPLDAARYERRFRAAMSRATQFALNSGTALSQPLGASPAQMQILGSQRGRFASVAVSGTRW